MAKLLDRLFNRTPEAPVADPANTDPGNGKGTGELVRTSNRWRDNYNPLRNLVISRVVTLLEAAERGDYAELQLVLRKVERRYPILKALKSRRLSALEKLDWDIKIMDPLPEGASEAMAEEQQKFLRSRYELIENLTEAFGFLVTPEFRGYAILQKHRCNDGGPNDGAVEELHWLPQDQFSRAGQFGDFYFNQDSRFGIGGDACAGALGEANRIGSAELPREEFILRECESPLYEIALIAFVNWSMGRKDWSACVEVFGLLKAIIIMPPSIPQGKEAEYREAAEKVSDGVAGALPNGSDAKFPAAEARNNTPFKEFCDAHDQDVVLAGTGGLLTMLSLPQGIGSGSSGEHGDAFDDIAEADARKITSIFQEQFDEIELEEQFPGQPRLAYFELCAVEQEDATEVIANIGGLKNAGYKVKSEQVEEKTGYELEEVAPVDPNLNLNPDPNLDPPNQPPMANRASAVRSPSAALSDILAPVLAQLDAIAKIDDPELQRRMLDSVVRNFPQLTEALKANPTLALAINPTIQKELKLGSAGRAATGLASQREASHPTL